VFARDMQSGCGRFCDKDIFIRKGKGDTAEKLADKN